MRIMVFNMGSNYIISEVIVFLLCRGEGAFLRAFTDSARASYLGMKTSEM